MVGREDVVYVLVLVQAAAGLLAMAGELLFMGNALYLVIPVVKAVVLLVLAVKVVGHRRWASIALLTFEGLSLVGVGVSLAVGLLPWVDRTVTLTGLLTEMGLPLIVIVYCAQSLVDRPQTIASSAVPVEQELTVPVDPWMATR